MHLCYYLYIYVVVITYKKTKNSNTLFQKKFGTN